MLLYNTHLECSQTFQPIVTHSNLHSVHVFWVYELSWAEAVGKLELNLLLIPDWPQCMEA